MSETSTRDLDVPVSLCRVGAPPPRAGGTSPRLQVDGPGAQAARSPGEGVASPAVARRRQMALWLAVLAAYRGGFLNRLLGQDGTVRAALDMDADEVRAVVRPARPARTGTAPDGQEESWFRRTLAVGPEGIAAELAGARFVAWDDSAYPQGLRQVKDAPPALFLRGRDQQGLRDLAELPVVAVVGTRHPSAYGREMTRILARDLSHAGVLVISGLAMGVDALAQQAAVTARLGAAGQPLPVHVTTVAVLGCGIDLIYPRENLRLGEQIATTGLIVSEFPSRVPANRWRFPCRNRIIAGLSRAVVVVEGGERSGSLITATFAGDLGRDVLAVPGEAGRKLSAGPHRLLRQGAHLCESADDVLELIGLGRAAWTRRPAAGAKVEGPLGALVAELDAGERTVDELAVAVQSRAADVAALLTSLEVDGVVARVAGGRYRLRRD